MHPHADHVHGIDAAGGERRTVTVYSNDLTQRRLHDGFGYCFRAPPGSAASAVPQACPVVPGTPFTVTGPGGSIDVTPFDQAHGDIRSLGLRIANIAYSCDFNDLPDESLRRLPGSTSGCSTRCVRRRIRRIAR